MFTMPKPSVSNAKFAYQLNINKTQWHFCIEYTLPCMQRIIVFQQGTSCLFAVEYSSCNIQAM